jgi:hypothetical protein
VSSSSKLPLRPFNADWHGVFLSEPARRAKIWIIPTAAMPGRIFDSRAHRNFAPAMK